LVEKANIKHSPVKLAIVGGGAAGLFAASVAADRGVGCLVFERKARVGSKMLMTANGRCNFTKDISPERMLADIGEPVASFVERAVKECPPSRILSGFRAFGLKTKRMMDGRIFPASEKAADVVHVFGDRLRDTSTPLLVNCPVTGIQPVKNGFIVATANFTVWASNVLLATGGLSFPKTGSVGDGQNFARALGHKIAPCRAGLTGLEVRMPWKYRPGTVRENAVGRVILDGKPVYEWRGEVEFMPWGVSGAAIYNCQRWIARRGCKAFVELELDGDGETPSLHRAGRHDVAMASSPLHGGETPSQHRAGRHDVAMASSPLHGGERYELKGAVPRPLKESIVTIGGVSLDEVDPDTMESKLVPGLYFAGEVLDIDGPTGGYNLSLAFATARLAVESVRRRSGGFEKEVRR